MMLTDLLHIAEDELVRDLLTAWQQEIIDRLIANQSQMVITVEETYVMEIQAS